MRGARFENSIAFGIRFLREAPSALIVRCKRRRLHDLPPEEVLSLTGFRGEQKERHRGREIQILADPALPFGTLIPRHLVDLRQDDEKGKTVILQPADQLAVFLRRIPPYVEDQNDEPEGSRWPR